MDIQFDQLINTSIKRLTKPKLKHEFTTFHDQKQFIAIPLIGQQLDETLQEANNEMMNSNDVSYDGIDADSAINYNPSFGKICTGENFRVLFTLMNTNAQFSIDNIKMKVVVQRQSLNQPNAQGAQQTQTKPKEDVLMHEVIKTIPAKSQMGFIFIFKVDFQDNYFMMIEIEYTSQYYTEQLKKFISNATNNEIDYKQLQSPQYEIDFNKKIVMRKFSKKYKFEANLPFEVRKSISLKNVKLQQLFTKHFCIQNEFILQIKIKNLSVNKIFLDKVIFHCINANQMKVLDINTHTQSLGFDESQVSVFGESVVFNPGEIRQYLFIIQHKDPAYKINKFEMHQLGQLELRWVNYLGDPGLLKIGPFKSNVEQKTKFEIDLDVVSQDQILKLEQPKSIMFRLYNLSNSVMKIQLSVKEKEVGDLLICGISKYNLGRLEPQASVDFSLDLFPKSCGVHPVCGLLIKDQASGREWIFKNVGDFLVEYE
eukprot:403372611